MSLPARFRSLRALLPALALPMALLALGACAEIPATGERQLLLMSASQEAALGAQAHPRLVAQFGGAYADPALQSYVERVGRRLAAVSERPDLGFTFTVLDSGAVNAFALPGGYVYVTRGLLALVNDEAELAGVLAHEIAHVTARHSAQRQTQSALAGAVLAGLGILAGPDLPRFAAPGAELLLKGYSREQEHMADELGVRYLARAGYDPRAAADFLAVMDRYKALEAALAGQAREDESPLAQYLSTHPQTGDRIERALAAAAAHPTAGGERGRDRLLDAVDGLIHGESPAQGFTRGRVFAHPELGFRFAVPEGFRLFNGQRQVVAASPDGALVIFDADRIRPGLSAAGYLTGVWGAGTRLEGVEAITVDGLPAATATTRATVRGRPVDARLVAIRWDEDTVYRFGFLTPPGLTAALDLPLRETTYSFRRLSPSEARALQPQRIDVVQVEPGDTLGRFAQGSSLGPHAEDRLRLLNALAPGAPLRPGQRIKVVR